MDTPTFCIQCASKDCTKTENYTFDICKYGIAYFNRDNRIEKKEPEVPVSNLSRNLRHEINPVLQVIISQVSKINPNLSAKRIDNKDPLSVIIGATVILDMFIQMITGVHEFHYQEDSININRKKLKLKQVITNSFNTYSILKEKGRTENLTLNNLVSDELEITICSEFINYIIAVLIDNAFKYSNDGSTFTITIKNKTEKKIDIMFSNLSKKIPKDFNIFELGIKCDESSKGFGYGLYWAKSLEFHYNNMTNLIDDDEGDKFQIMHEGTAHRDKRYEFQNFTLKNVLL